MTNDDAEFRARAEADFLRRRDEVARIKAQGSDKEPFTIEGLERELNEHGETTLGLSRRELEAAEQSYYLSPRAPSTLAELAERIAMNEPARPSPDVLDRRVDDCKRAAPGKEPFSVDALRSALGSRAELLDGCTPAQLEWYELSYYLHHPELATVAELAATITGALRARP